MNTLTLPIVVVLLLMLLATPRHVVCCLRDIVVEVICHMMWSVWQSTTVASEVELGLCAALEIL